MSRIRICIILISLWSLFISSTDFSQNNIDQQILVADTFVRLMISNPIGQQIISPVNNVQEAGFHEFNFDA